GVQDKLYILLHIEQTPVHLMLSKESTTEAQLQRINQAIDQLKQSPDYQQILDRYQFRSLHSQENTHK
ncbi:ABC transporter substrate-binding protein, partial [Aeromonas veronii]|nr:ABC transporter substrate-binding protein [Aeromonas veronii]